MRSSTRPLLYSTGDGRVDSLCWGYKGEHVVYRTRGLGPSPYMGLCHVCPGVSNSHMIQHGASRLGFLNSKWFMEIKISASV